MTTLIPSDLPSSSSVLEVGCGTGRITRALASRFTTITVNDIAVDLAREVGLRTGAAVMEEPIESCLDDIQYDLVVCSEVIEHTLCPKRFARALCRKVKPGGTLVLTTPNPIWFPLIWVVQKLGLRKFNGIENWTWPRRMINWLEGDGLQVDLTSGCHLIPWQIPGAKLLLPKFDRLGRVLFPVMINYGVRATRRLGSVN